MLCVEGTPSWQGARAKHTAASMFCIATTSEVALPCMDGLAIGSCSSCAMKSMGAGIFACAGVRQHPTRATFKLSKACARTGTRPPSRGWHAHRRHTHTHRERAGSADAFLQRGIRTSVLAQAVCDLSTLARGLASRSISRVHGPLLNFRTCRLAAEVHRSLLQIRKLGGESGMSLRSRLNTGARELAAHQDPISDKWKADS